MRNIFLITPSLKALLKATPIVVRLEQTAIKIKRVHGEIAIFVIAKVKFWINFVNIGFQLLV